MCGRYFFNLESELLPELLSRSPEETTGTGSRISSWRNFSVKSCCDIKKKGRKQSHSGNHEVGIYRI